MEEEKIILIKNIKKEIYNHLVILSNLEKKLKDEQKTLKSICNHDYIRENDGDYHKLTYYLVCSKCSYSKKTK